MGYYSKETIVKRLLKFTLELAENGVLFREGDKTFVFNSPIDLGAQLFNMVSSAPEIPASYECYLLCPPADKLISAIKCVRMLSGDGLKESKDIADKARADGKCLIKKGLDEMDVKVYKNQINANADYLDPKYFVFEEHYD